MLFQEEVYFQSYGNYSFGEVFNSVLFRSWKYSKGRSSIYDLVKDLKLNDRHEDNIIKKVDTEIDVYKLLQLDINILAFAEKNKKIINADYFLTNKSFFEEATNKFTYILDKAGFKLIKHNTEDYYLIIPRDERVRSVAENTDKDTAFLLYEYTSPLIKDNVKEKRRILKLLTNKYESLVKRYKEKYKSGPIYGLVDDLSFILNNYELRHPNLDPLIPQYYKEVLTHYNTAQWIEIYDTAYSIILAVSMLAQYNETFAKVVDKHKKL